MVDFDKDVAGLPARVLWVVCLTLPVQMIPPSGNICKPCIQACTDVIVKKKSVVNL